MTEKLGKRELNKARRRAAIVDVAMRSFLHRGYGETTMSGIADSLGGSKATLWSHFSSKEEVFAAVMDALVESFSADTDEVLTGQTFTVEAMRRACHRFMECLMHPDSVLLFRLMISQSGRFPELKDMFYDRGPAKLRLRFWEFLATRFEDEDAWNLTRLIVSAINGYRAEILLRPFETSLEERHAFVDRLVDTIHWPEQRKQSAGQEG
ncbi:TetR/AcrR family transcriptional regulator [Novosphingobium sp. 9]|uniref:TetR/AcrR family transcriptional regulator n=1 Tax=Novosphingobium sp. 9 TaxID=2025349 RepID=UPI0021B5D2F7|nr:TetR/AcrR family transcriptional regulator [Novosphingobium sp. 9]